MSVKKEASGRRSVQVEVEVPGTPEEVWQAIATGPGISSWFVPAEFEERDGKPVAVKLDFGPGMETRTAVTAWDPPRTFAGRARDGRRVAAHRNRVDRRSARGRRLRRPHGQQPVRQHGRVGQPTGRRQFGWPGFCRTCAFISRTSAVNAPRSCRTWPPSPVRTRRRGKR